MRQSSIVLLFCVLSGLVGCNSGRGDHVVSDAGPHDSGALSDAGNVHDAGPISDAGSTGDGGPHDGGAVGDAGPTSDGGPHDGGLIGDAGTSIDAGSSSDAGPHVAGESCAMPIDVSAGGTFMIDTCMFTDTVTASCATAPGPDVVLRGDTPATYQLHVGAGAVVGTGAVIEQTDSSCAAMLLSCGSPDWNSSGAALGGHFYWAVQRTDGSCGPVTITVDRS